MFGDSDSGAISPGATVVLNLVSFEAPKSHTFPAGYVTMGFAHGGRAAEGVICVQISFFGRRDWASSSGSLCDMLDLWLVVSRAVEECQAWRWG